MPISASAACSHNNYGPIYSEASHPHRYFKQCKTCLDIVYTGGNATKNHGDGAWGSGTCPSCGTHTYVGRTCTKSGVCACGSTIGPSDHIWYAVYSDATHPHKKYNYDYGGCKDYLYPAQYDTKNHGDGTWGSGTCPSCGDHTFVGLTCINDGVCSCGATRYADGLSHSPYGIHPEYEHQHPHIGLLPCKYCHLMIQVAEHQGEFDGCGLCTPDEVYYGYYSGIPYEFKWSVSENEYDAYLKINADGLTDYYANSQYETARKKWNNLSPEVSIEPALNEYANVKLLNPSIEFWETLFGDDATDTMGQTYLYDSSGSLQLGPNTPPSYRPIAVHRASILINPFNNFDPLNEIPPQHEDEQQKARALKVLIHEIGHVLGLGHPSGNPNAPDITVPSIMQQGFLNGISFFLDPQEKDIISVRIKYGY